jgi:steroid delta-isomerase-like uncharacterized protein
MHTEAVRRFLFRYIDAVWHKHDLDAVRDYWHPNCRNHYAPEYPSGADGLKKQLLPFFTAFNDFKIDVEDMLIDDDMIAVRACVYATQQYAFAGLPNTGKRIILRTSTWYRMVDGKLHDMWPIYDWAAVIEQLREEGA